MMFTPDPKSYTHILWSQLVSVGAALRQRLTSAVAVSWWAWIAAVAAFAIWTARTYQSPEPRWFGMLVHVTTFAVVSMLIRAWIVINILPE
jgi:hypothetical protein